MTPLYAPFSQPHPRNTLSPFITPYLLQELMPIEIDRVNFGGSSAVYRAAEENQPGTCRALMEAGANMRALKGSFAPIHIAARNASIDALAYLLNADPSLMLTKTADGVSPHVLMSHAC